MDIAEFEQAEAAPRERIKRAIEKLATIDFAKLQYSTHGAHANFGPIVDHAYRPTVELLRHLLSIEGLLALPGSVLGDVASKCEEVLRMSSEMDAFSPTDAQWQANYDRIARGARELCKQSFAVLLPLLVHLEHRNPSFDEVENKLARAESRIHAIESRTIAIENKKESVEALEKKAERALEVANDAARKAGLTAYGEAFKTEAEASADQAVKWAIGLALGVVTLLGWIWYATAKIKPEPSDAHWSAHARQLGAEILVISLFSYVVVWCAKNFRAARHNAIVNRHRHNALATFERFVAGLADEETKNAVLLQATQAIFAPQPSGTPTRTPRTRCRSSSSSRRPAARPRGKAADKDVQRGSRRRLRGPGRAFGLGTFVTHAGRAIDDCRGRAERSIAPRKRSTYRELRSYDYERARFHRMPVAAARRSLAGADQLAINQR